MFHCIIIFTLRRSPFLWTFNSRVQLVRVRGGYNLCGAGADTEYKFMCGFSQARRPTGPGAGMI